MGRRLTDWEIRFTIALPSRPAARRSGRTRKGPGMNSLHPEDTAASLERVQRVCTDASLCEQQNDLACWQIRPCCVRLATLEQIRQDYNRWRYGAEPRLGKSYSVAR